MRHGPTELQSLPLPLDGRRNADAARFKDANSEHINGISARRRAVVLGKRHECMRDEVVRRRMGRHEGVGPADGGDGDDSGPLGQQHRTCFDCAGELEGVMRDRINSIVHCTQNGPGHADIIEAFLIFCFIVMIPSS